MQILYTVGRLTGVKPVSTVFLSEVTKMSDDRYFSGSVNRDGSSPTPFAGRSARGYASGSTTVFTNAGVSARTPNQPQRKSAAAAGASAAGAFGEYIEALDRQPAQPRPTTQPASFRQTSDDARTPQRTAASPQRTRPTPDRRQAEHRAATADKPSSPQRKAQSPAKKNTAKNTKSSKSADSKKTSKGANGSGGENPPAAKKRNKGVIVLSVILAVIILIGGCGAGALGFVLKDYKNTELADNAYVSEDKLKSSSKITNILLMGIDTEDTEAATRSDAMILMSIDSVHRRIKLTSFLRDMYVTVPGHGETKLTHACSYKNGGPQLTCDTIELNFGIKIDGFAKIGYDVFKEIIEAVGGITVAEIDATESKALAELEVYIDPGTNIHLDGNQALAYCRIRHGQSDFQRTERQRETIMLVLSKMKKTDPLKLVKLANSVASKVVSSMSKSQLIELAFKVLPCLLGSVEQTQIPTDGAWSYGTRDGLSVVLVDLEKNKNFLYEWIYGE